RWATDYWLRGAPRKNDHLQGFHRRILQLHLCLIYFFGGVTKCAGPGWWDGASIWRALIRPPFNLFPPETLIAWKNLFPVLSISVCLLESAYPLFIWLRKTRIAWLVAVITMHLAIGLAMGLYLFALVMITLNFAAFWPMRDSGARRGRGSGGNDPARPRKYARLTVRAVSGGRARA